jgi:hypothetical protein
LPATLDRTRTQEGHDPLYHWRHSQADLPPTIFGDALKKQEVIAIFYLKCRHVNRQISFDR